MADGFTLEIDADLAALIERRASEAGVSREDLARNTLAQQMFRHEDYEWIGDDPRTTVTPYDPDAPTVPWEEVERWMRSWGKADELPKPRPR